MSTKKWLLSIVMIGLFSQSFLWTAQYKMETLFEKGFDAEIEDVIFDSYEEDGAVRFYPKIVILKHLDEALSQGDYKFYKKEVRLFNAKGAVVKDLWFPYRSRVNCSKKGNYFYVWTIVREKLEPYHPSKIHDTEIIESNFSVYNDRGEIVWRQSPFSVDADKVHYLVISPKDGSLFEFIDEEVVNFYDNRGLKYSITPQELKGCQFEFFGFNDNYERGIILAHKHPEKSFTGNAEPTLFLVDSRLNLLWEKPLDEGFYYRAAISPYSSYVYASAYTSQSFSGYLYDKNGELLMKITNGAYPIAFSSDERYLIIQSLKPIKGLRSIRGIMVIDIKTKKVALQKELEVNRSEGLIAPDRTMALIELSYPKVNQSLSREEVSSLRIERTSEKISILNSKGVVTYETDDYKLLKDKVTLSILSWDGIELIFGVTNKKFNKIEINSVRFKEE